MQKLDQLETEKPWIIEFYRKAADNTEQKTKNASKAQKAVFHENFALDSKKGKA